MRCLLGLDIGSSSLKAGLFGERGEVLAMASHAYETAEPRPGYKEQNPADWWNAAVNGIHELLAAAPEARILAIGTSGCISSLTFVDAEGSVLRPSLAFQDRRADEEVREIEGQFSREELAAWLGIDLPPAPQWPLPRLVWMRKHEPALLERTRFLLQAKDYINLRLTGEAASDASSNRGMADLSTGRAATELFSRLDLPDLLPPLLAPEQVVGRVTRTAALETGLAAGVPVIAGWNDLNASVLGSGAVKPGQGFDVTGTSEHIGMVAAACRPARQLICAPYLPGRKLFYGVTSSGGGSLHWFARFSGKSAGELLASAAAAPGGLLFLPYLEGERSPVWDPHASGVLLGLRGSHGEGDVARAILEGVAFSLRQNLELVEAHAPFRPDALIASGGAAQADLWNQIKADALGKEVTTLRNPHAGMQGAAILAAVAAGLYADAETAALAMTEVSRRFAPHPANRGRMDRLYALYNEIYPALQETMARLGAEGSSNLDAEGSSEPGEEIQ